MIRSAPAKPEDLKKLKPQKVQLDQAGDMEYELIGLLQESWTSITIWDEDDALAIVGIIERNPGYSSVWAVVTQDLAGKGLRLTSEVRLLIEHLQKTCKLRRMDMYVLASCRRHVVWARRLGFKIEGTLKKLGLNGEDYFMMARTW